MPALEPGQRWGILGGMFDPVHLGHLSLAENIRTARDLDGVLLVPSYDPPHRSEQPRAPFDDRVAMLELAVGDLPGLEVSNIEALLERPGYTLLTVRALNAVGALPAILDALEAVGLQAGDVRVRKNTLEDVFIQLTGRRLRE